MKQYVILTGRGSSLMDMSVSEPMNITQLLAAVDLSPKEVDDITSLSIGEKYRVDEHFVMRVESLSQVWVMQWYTRPLTGILADTTLEHTCTYPSFETADMAAKRLVTFKHPRNIFGDEYVIIGPVSVTQQ